MSPSDLEVDPPSEPSLVRPYALVRGRTRRGEAAPLPVETVIVTRRVADGADLQLEPAAIVRICQHPSSLLEVASELSLPVGVVRVLVADLSADGLVEVNLPLDPRRDDRTDRVLLERVLAGLEAL